MKVEYREEVRMLISMVTYPNSPEKGIDRLFYLIRGGYYVDDEFISEWSQYLPA